MLVAWLLVSHGLVGRNVNGLWSLDGLLALGLGSLSLGSWANTKADHTAAKSGIAIIEHNGAADNGLGACEIDIRDGVEASIFKAAKSTWGGLILSFAVAGCADAGVEHTTGGVAAIAQVTESVDGDSEVLAVAKVEEFTPDGSASHLRQLSKLDKTLDIVLVLWVEKDALGVDLSVLTDSWVSSLLNSVAVVGNRLLVLCGHFNNRVTLTLDVGVGW